MFVIISGPSASGKSTAVEFICSNFDYSLSVSYTTREKRENEVNGINYHFIEKSQFLDYLDKGLILEHSYFNNNYYGTPVLPEKNKNLVFDVEIEGLCYFKEKFKDSIQILIMADIKTLEKRLKKRKTGKEEIKRRLSNYEKYKELENKIDFVINGDKDLEEVKKEIKEIFKRISI